LSSTSSLKANSPVFWKGLTRSLKNWKSRSVKALSLSLGAHLFASSFSYAFHRTCLS
jgi:hypothetical protein